MLRGIDTAASGMIALERRQEALSANLANVQTPGYKQDNTQFRAFPELLMQRINDFNQIGNLPITVPGQKVPIGGMYNGVYAQERVPNFTEGPLQETDNPLDIAIDDQSLPTQQVNGQQVKPAAFFAVKMSDGTVGYTRNGKWDLDANGNLVTSDGYRVLGADHQPIKITDSISQGDLKIDGNGNIIAYPSDPTKTKTVGQLGVAIIQNPNSLSRVGGNVYQTTNPVQFMTDGGGTNPGISVQQGYLEQSNVDAAQTMSDMMSTVRAYEANQKVISAYDTSLQNLNSVAKLNG